MFYIIHPEGDYGITIISMTISLLWDSRFFL